MTDQSPSSGLSVSRDIGPELDRLREGIDLLERLRELFYEMADDGERDRAWRFLSDRFAEFEKSEIPAWEAIEANR